jgi:hypothetical protein
MGNFCGVLPLMQPSGPSAHALEPRPLRLPRPLRRSGALSLACRPFAVPLPVLAEAHLGEQEADRVHAPEADQDQRQDLTESTADRHRADRAGQDEQPGGAVADDPGSSAHGIPPGLINPLLVSVHVIGHVELGQLVDEPE